MTSTTLPLSIRRAVRQHAGARANMPVDVIDGSDAPEVTGRSYYWTTPGGRPVYHPAAYRRAYGKPVYHGSTLSVEVGVEWLAARFPEFAAALAIGAGI